MASWRVPASGDTITDKELKSIAITAGRTYVMASERLD